ncbi:hypothetical protein BKH43_06405 [Helicobacter sp. 13S00401-1]|uniref:TolC family protein n=1 Tax=Helicobacter sp. 13S00401-1 TaxID=1905758 RepID=UPI000BD2BA12|nr:TolC family protein [Helicobacter sp. 13S00401-1]PAF49717.1 hypothetical protein BKH43_06405 [Helicobacter sp. 13S00401-1]
MRSNLRFKALALILLLPANLLFAEVLSISDFKRAIDANSLELNSNKANYESQLNQAKSDISWQFPYIEASGNTEPDGRGGTMFTSTTLFMLKPTLPWVNSLLKEALKVKGLEYKEATGLVKNIAFINAKKMYLTYEAIKEKYRYDIQREINFLTLLNIAKKKLEAGSLSQKDYVNFESAYIAANLTSLSTKNDLVKAQQDLYVILGLKDAPFLNNSSKKDISNILSNTTSELARLKEVERSITHNHNDLRVQGLDMNFEKLNEALTLAKLENSPYINILNSQTKSYELLARQASRDIFPAGDLIVGLGVNTTGPSTGAAFDVQIPLPITKKQTHLKAKYMVLGQSTLYKSNITKNTLRIKVKAYLQQMDISRHYMQIAKEDIKIKRKLAALTKLAYDAQKSNLFEYITYENAYVDSQIQLVDQKIRYIQTLALLEETLGESFSK